MQELLITVYAVGVVVFIGSIARKSVQFYKGQR